ncbi:MAG: hypothetical protein ABFR19_04075 [Pseudomonadota bacterium]
MTTIMQYRSARVILLLTLLTLVSCVSFSGGLSNKWRIEVSEGANSSGDMLFRVSPKGQPATDVNVHITDNMRENVVAIAIMDAFRAQLPSDGYHVERDDGEDVLVKRRGSTPNFGLQLISSDVKSVRINLDKE